MALRPAVPRRCGFHAAHLTAGLPPIGQAIRQEFPRSEKLGLTIEPPGLAGNDEAHIGVKLILGQGLVVAGRILK